MEYDLHLIYITNRFKDGMGPSDVRAENAGIGQCFRCAQSESQWNNKSTKLSSSAPAQRA
jgi:hypothetical protein